MRVLECSTQSDGWPQVLDFIDETLGCTSFLSEFDENGTPQPRFGGTPPAETLGQVLQRIETEGGRTALQFLLSEAALFYPYCKTTLARNAPASDPSKDHAPDTVASQTPSQMEAADGSSAEDKLHMAPGLVSPIWRSGRSTILFSCFFSSHDLDAIDTDTASETFRTIVKMLEPGLNIHFEMEKKRLDNEHQRLLLSSAEGPALLVNADRDILAWTPSALEALARADIASQARQTLLVKNKQLDAALLELAVATRQHPDRQSGIAGPPPQRSVFIADPEGFLKRVTISTVIPAHPAHNQSAMFVVRLVETRELSGEIEKCLQDHFDLSQSEAHLARHLTVTGSMNATADDLAITRNTAKTHLRRIYEKTGVNTQLQLAMLVHRLAQLF
ncbi:helix-turn-helix transcriptional regulator [Roseibium sp. Sym1]|uniref:helix-turn-helix transcriptional regulator n=1 Tax=Roseibium sp. Sym1 TaxID=3016006 RepID=UPI0022B3F043|nr:helix-turn-helix transcriptional regulator [Roseibium sp. Sym1]